MTSTLRVLTLVLLGACSHEQVVKGTSGPPAGKTGAPVQVDFEVSTVEAKVAVTFFSAGQDVTIDVRGLDGLELTPVRAGPRAVAAGEVVQVPTAVQVARGTVVVTVSGLFAGGRLDRVASLAVGRTRPVKVGERVDTDEGPVKLLPAGQ